MKASSAGALLVSASFMGAGMAMAISVTASLGHWSLIALGRLAIGALVAFVIIRWRGASAWQRPEPWGWVRIACATLGVPAAFHAMSHLPPAISVTLVSTGPIWAVAGQALLQRRLPPALSVFCLLLAGAGIVVLQGGGWNAASTAVHLAFGTALFNGVCRGGAIVSATRITSTPASVQVTHATLGALVSTSILVLATVDIQMLGSSLSLAFVGLVVAIAITATIANILATTAFQVGSAARLIPLIYLTPVLAVAGEILIWGRIPAPRELVGISIVVGASLLVRAVKNEACLMSLELQTAFEFSSDELQADGSKHIARIEQAGYIEVVVQVFISPREAPVAIAHTSFQEQLAQVSRGHGMLLAFFPKTQELVVIAGHFVEQRVSKRRLKDQVARAKNIDELFMAIESEVGRSMPVRDERANEVPDEVRVSEM